MSRGPDASVLLARALVQSAADAEDSMIVGIEGTSDWASATFIGSRHKVSLRGATFATFEEWLAGLGEADLPLAGNILADLTVTSKTLMGDRFEVTLEALTVEAELQPPLQPRVASRRNMPSVS